MAKILIAEDEPDIRDLIMFTLQFGGYDVIATSSGSEAIERAVAEQPDLILLDVRMPRMTGYEACEALKGNPQTEKIPVVFLSAKGQEKEVENGLKVGAVAYILKPFAPDQLIKQVKELLDQHGVKPSEKVAPVAPAAEAAAAKAAPPEPTPAKDKGAAGAAVPAAEVAPAKTPASEPAPAKDEASAAPPADHPAPKKEKAEGAAPDDKEKDA